MTDVEVFENYESEVRSYCRSFPAVFTTSKGSIMKDENGKEYIDFFCGAGALNYGHNNDYIKEKMVAYLMSDGIMHSMDMMTVPKKEFLQFFEEKVLQPRGLNFKVMFPGPTGTNGVEAALKLARKVKKRNQIWALMGCFHGMTLGALSLTSDAGSRGGAGVCLNDVTHIPAPYMFPELDTIKYMETLLTDDHSGVEKPAAIIIETVQAEGGVHVFSNEYLQGVRALCDKYDILMIVDDIQVGCARTGTFFSFERAGIVPDMFVMSKSIGGYGMPFALTMFKPELDIWSPGEHNGTFRGNQLSMVAAKAGLEYMLDHKVEAEVKRKEGIIRKYMDENIARPGVEIRGIGCIWGVQVGVCLNDVTHIPAPYMFPELDTIKYMETLLTDDHSGVEKPAAIIIETVQAEGGVHVFSNEYLQGVRALCDKYDILMIVDDIQVGCARTGTFFSFERAGIVPDMFVMSKSIGGYGMPFALTMFKPELDIWSPGEHNGTFRGNQLSMVAAKAGLEYMLDHKVEAEVKRKEGIIRKYMDENIARPGVEIRGIGCIWGVQVADGKLALAICNKCFEKGLIMERAGRDNNVLKLMPALVATDDELMRGLDIIRDSMNELM